MQNVIGLTIFAENAAHLGFLCLKMDRQLLLVL